jgi:hypothetical protein
MPNATGGATAQSRAGTNIAITIPLSAMLLLALYTLADVINLLLKVRYPLQYLARASISTKLISLNLEAL